METNEALADAAVLFKTLSTPSRLAILVALSEGEKYVHDLVEELGLKQPLVSQHLRILRSARLVTPRREGREISYRLTDEHIAHIVRDAMIHISEESSPSEL